ncbi:MAG: YHS domain-containing protein [Chloroflexi bacterium]|nr:YHS domain-containing protein [Chloroflexota bacterium]
MSASDDPLGLAVALRERREPFALATVVACRRPTSAYPGAKALIDAEGAFSGWVGGSCAQPLVLREALASIEDGKPRLLRISPDPDLDGEPEEGVIELAMPCQSQGALEIYVEPFLPRPELVVIGETPLAQALASAGKLIEFEVTVSDPDATAERFPDADLLLTDLEATAARLRADSYVVVATQGQYDEDALAAVLRSEAAYVGLVASVKRAEAVLHYLRGSGFGLHELERLHCPAGLSLGAVTPPEIALSIAAEILQVRREQPARQPEPAASSAPEPLILTPMPAAGSEHAPESTLEPLILTPVPSAGGEQALDPICGMTVDVATARHTTEHEGQTVYFCAAVCRQRFEQEPERYAAALR